MNEFDWSIIFETKIVFLTASMFKNSFQIFIYPSKLKILNVRWYVLEHISLFESLKEQSLKQVLEKVSICRSELTSLLEMKFNFD